MSLRSSLLSLCLAASLFAADAAVESAKKQIAAKKYDEAIATLEPALKAKPKSVEVSKALSEAYTGKADVTMNNAALPPRQKYPEALRAFRKAVELDKDNKKAKEGADMIEGIYKQMGRPVPQ
jgi:tetratricopeptide (TPR) repeat protein